VGQKHEKFREFRTPFHPRDIRKNPRSMYARVPQAMAQFVLKIELLSHIMGTTQGQGRTLCDAWHFFCVWIIHQKLTSYPVKKQAERQNQI